MHRRLSFITGIAFGAGLMYALDPDRGRRRRALARDQALSRARQVADAADAMARDARNRARGVVAETAARLRAAPVEDRVLEERVRAKLGHVVAHAGAIEVSADHGRVELRGPALARDVDAVLSSALAVRGVREIENRLDIRRGSDGALRDATSG